MPFIILLSQYYCQCCTVRRYLPYKDSRCNIQGTHDICRSWCVCNIFGFNCDACGECSKPYWEQPEYQAQFQVPTRNWNRQLPEAEEQDQVPEWHDENSNINNNCDDFDKYMSLTPKEKLDWLSPELLKVAKGDDGGVIYDEAEFVYIVSLAFDTDGECKMSCEEFNNATNDVAETIAFVKQYL
jgi:hypothetical protein